MMPRPTRRQHRRLWLAYSADRQTRRFVEAHPSGADREVIGKDLGVSREAVRQIERQAMGQLAGRIVLDLWRAGLPVRETIADLCAGREPPDAWLYVVGEGTGT